MTGKMNMVNKARALDVWEVFEKIDKAKSRKQKLEILQNDQRMVLRDVFRGFFDNKIQWNLPGGTPPYTPQVDGPPPPATLLKEHLKFKYFVKGFSESERLQTVKRERMFIDILESVHPKDAEILVAMINKQKPDYDGLTENLVKEAYPDLIPA